MSMNKMYKRLINIVCVCVCLIAFNIVAFAQGTTSISVSKSAPAVGDSVTVSVTSTENGSITVKYTSSMLTFSSCNVSGYSAEGNSVTFKGKEGEIVFSASASGTASIIVSSTANSGSSTTLTIGGSGAAASTTTTEKPAETTTEETTEQETTEEETTTEETTEAPAASTSGAVGTLNSDGGFDINGTAYVVSERFTDQEMPAGFKKTTIKIGSSTYGEPTNGSITLLYLKPADNTAGSGVFYLYDEAAGTVSEFLMVGSKDSYVIISTPDGGPSSAFTATSVDVTGGTATAYTVDGSEFYYVYGTNQDGSTGWYVYDKTYETVSRMDPSVLSTTTSVEAPAEDTEEDDASTDTSVYIQKLNLYRKIIMGLIVLCVVLLFVLINKALRGHGDDDDDFDGDVFAKAPVKTSRKLPRSIVFTSKESEYEEDDEDEYDEDEDEYYDDEEDYDDTDASRARYESESYEARRASSLNMMDLNDL